MNTNELSASEHTPKAVLSASWQEPRDEWTLWVSLPTKGQYNGLCVASFGPKLRASQRRLFSPILTRLMNGIVTVDEAETIPAGDWTAAGKRVICLSGNAAIKMSSSLDNDVATALRDHILQRLISVR